MRGPERFVTTWAPSMSRNFMGEILCGISQMFQQNSLTLCTSPHLFHQQHATSPWVHATTIGPRCQKNEAFEWLLGVCYHSTGKKTYAKRIATFDYRSVNAKENSQIIKFYNFQVCCEY